MANKKSSLEVTSIALSELRPPEYYARTHSEQQLQDLIISLEHFDQVVPLVVNKHKDRNNIIIGGNMTLEACKRLKHKKVPIVYVNLSLQQERELYLRLNTAGGDWDYDKLRELFEMEELLDCGFTDSEMSSMWDDLIELENDKEPTKKEIDTKAKSKTKPAQLIRLGRHTLLCGDSLDLKNVERITKDQQVSIVISDPPYNIDLDYDGGVGKDASYGGKVDDKLTDNQFRTFLITSISNAYKYVMTDCHFFYFCDQKYAGMIQDIYGELNIDYKRTCLWIKNNANITPQIAFNKTYEPCVYGMKGKPELSNVKKFSEVLNKEVGNGNQQLEDIYDLFDIWLARRDATQDYQHPTQKPITLYEKPLRRCTKPGDTILDLFGGSGSSLLAAEQLGRTALLIERDPIFCDVIVKRFEALTGTKAVYEG